LLTATMKLTIAFLASAALSASAFNAPSVAFQTSSASMARTSVVLEASRNKQKIASRSKWAEARGYGDPKEGLGLPLLAGKSQLRISQTMSSKARKFLSGVM